MKTFKIKSVTLEGYGPFKKKTSYPLSERGVVLVRGDLDAAGRGMTLPGPVVGALVDLEDAEAWIIPSRGSKAVEGPVRAAVENHDQLEIDPGLGENASDEALDDPLLVVSGHDDRDQTGGFLQIEAILELRRESGDPKHSNLDDDPVEAGQDSAATEESGENGGRREHGPGILRPHGHPRRWFV